MMSMNHTPIFIEAITLEPSWKDKVIAKIAAISENDRILKEKTRLNEKLKRLARAYVDGLVEEREYTYPAQIIAG